MCIVYILCVQACAVCLDRVAVGITVEGQRRQGIGRGCIAGFVATVTAAEANKRERDK
jgi:hypothetical protein